VGSHVFYPAHGVAEVTGIEKRELGQEQHEFYVLELCQGGKLLLPMAKVAPSGVRALISAAHARELTKTVTSEPQLDEGPWRERAEIYAESLRDGAADGYTETLRQLLFRSKNDKLTTTERRQFDTARAYFVAEISVVLDQPTAQIEAQLQAVTETDGKPKK